MDDAWTVVIFLLVVLGIAAMVLYALTHQPVVLGGAVL